MSSKLNGRYSTRGVVEGEFELGSHNRVLKNLLGIKRKREMEIAESAAYDNVTIKTMDLFGKSHHFTANNICKMHKAWLGGIYSWAGEYRGVNMSKGNFQFASAYLIPKLMKEFEHDILKKYTPCSFSSLEEIAAAIAIVHTEFILIHPFREGNGRLGRLISVLMGLQADLPILNFESIKGKKKEEYILAVQAGLDRDYKPMKRVFELIIGRTLKLYHEK